MLNRRILANCTLKDFVCGLRILYSPVAGSIVIPVGCCLVPVLVDKSFVDLEASPVVEDVDKRDCAEQEDPGKSYN